MSYTKEPDIIRYNKTFERYRQQRKTWEDRAFEYEMFIRNDIEGTGTQFTKEQLKTIKDKYSIPLSVNIGFAIKEQMLAMMTSAIPVMDVYPVGEASKHFAYVWREILYANFQFNKLYQQIKRSLGHMVDVGHGLMRVRPNRFFKRNIFNCVIECVRWEYCYFDPSSEEPDFSDCEMQFVAIPVEKEKAKKEYKLTDEECEQASSVLADHWSPTISSHSKVYNGMEESKSLWIMDIYEKTKQMVYVNPDGTTTFGQSLDNPSVSSSGQIVEKGDYIDAYEDVFIKYSLKIGNIIKYSTLMPITNYCLIPFVFTHVDSPYSLGLTHHTVDLYKTANKAMALTIENVQKGGNTGLYAYEGSIVNRDTFEKVSSTPGGVVEIEANPSLPNGGMPVQKQIPPLPNAWFTLFHALIDLAKYVSGVLDMVQGDSSTAPDTAGATNSLIQQGTQRIKMHVRDMDSSMERLCELVIEFMQSYAPYNNILTYVSPTEAKMRIKTDVEGSITQGQDGQPKFNPQENAQQLATIVENMTNNQIVAYIGTPNVGKYKVHYRAGSNMPNTRMMANQIITSAMSRMQGDSTALALLKASLKLLDIPEVDKALEEADFTEQQAQQIQQLQQQLTEIALDNKKLEEKYYKEVEKVHLAEIGAKVDKAASKVDIELSKIKEGVKEANKPKEKTYEYN